MNARIQIIEQQQQSLQQRMEKMEESQIQQQELLNKILSIVTSDKNENYFQLNSTQQNIMKNNHLESFNSVYQIANSFNIEVCNKDNQIPPQITNNEEFKDEINLQNDAIQKSLNISQWQTWLEVLPNKNQPIYCDYKGCKTQGDRRLYFNKNGVKFEKIVKTLISVLKYAPENPGYTIEVAKQIIGVEIQQGFKLKKVLGAGSVGTTVLAYDKQEDKEIALKIYHVPHSITSGLREYKMLHLSQKAPSIVKVNSLMYNSNGSFLAISLENLSSYSTVYSFVEQEQVEIDQKLLIVRNIARALAELHSIKVVHGDISTENIFIDVKSQDVKIIDFDISAKEGEKVQPAGNPDFITNEIQENLDSKKTIKATYKNDIYALGLLCFLILGDNEKKFFNSLSSDPLSVQFKEKMIEQEKFIGQNIVVKMISKNISAAESAIQFNQLLEQRKQKHFKQ